MAPPPIHPLVPVVPPPHTAPLRLTSPRLARSLRPSLPSCRHLEIASSSMMSSAPVGRIELWKSAAASCFVYPHRWRRMTTSGRLRVQTCLRCAQRYTNTGLLCVCGRSRQDYSTSHADSATLHRLIQGEASLKYCYNHDIHSTHPYNPSSSLSNVQKRQMVPNHLAVSPRTSTCLRTRSRQARRRSRFVSASSSAAPMCPTGSSSCLLPGQTNCARSSLVRSRQALPLAPSSGRAHVLTTVPFPRRASDSST